MSSKDLSLTELIRKRKGLILRVFHKNNPTKQLEGPNGITSYTAYLAMQAYQGSISCISDVPVCPSVLYSDIATYDGSVGGFVLNANTTILACQTLIIPTGISFAITDGRTLTNLGTINIAGFFFNTGTIINAGTFISNGTTNNTVNSVFRNTGSIQITGTGFFANTDATSTLFNTGRIVNNNFGNFTNGGTIYNYQGGAITNNGSFIIISGQKVYNPTSSGSPCGVGILNGSAPITATGNNCPPS